LEKATGGLSALKGFSKKFMEPDDLLLYSQKSSAGPYPEINPIHATSFYVLEIHFNIILNLCPILSSRLFLSEFPIKVINAFIMRAILLAYLILLVLIILITLNEEYKS
jgi:hypothetical protein